jgi:hypothetical protein
MKISSYSGHLTKATFWENGFENIVDLHRAIISSKLILEKFYKNLNNIM